MNGIHINARHAVGHRNDVVRSDDRESEWIRNIRCAQSARRRPTERADTARVQLRGIAEADRRIRPAIHLRG